MAGHYPNADIAKLASKKYENTEFVIVKEPDLVEGETGDHAGKWETSLLMVLFPELVNLKLMENKEDRLMAVEGIDPAESSEIYGKEILGKILVKIEALLKYNV